MIVILMAGVRALMLNENDGELADMGDSSWQMRIPFVLNYSRMCSGKQQVSLLGCIYVLRRYIHCVQYDSPDSYSSIYNVFLSLAKNLPDE